MINSYGLLSSFDSDNVKIIDRFIDKDKSCYIYSNGRVLYKNNKNEKVIHLDTLYCTSIGFVKSDDNIIRIYTCILGVVCIYLIEENDVITINLPSKLYHIRNNCVKFFNNTYYTIAGVQTKIDNDEIKTGVENFSIETITLNDIKYAITNNGLFMSTVVETSGAENNVGRNFSYLTLLSKYDIIDFDINSSIVMAICRNGAILYNDSLTTIINTGSVYCTYDPSISVRVPDPYLSINISDTTSFKLVDEYYDMTTNLKKRKMTFFTYCPDGSTRTCDIFEDDSAIIHYSNGDKFVNKKPIFLNNVSFASDYQVEDSTFNNPERVTFSKDGSRVVISRGKYGLVYVDEDSYRYIFRDIGFKSESEVKSGIFADDGFLYIALRGRGYVLRNSFKDKYHSFFDIVATSMIINDGQLDENTNVSNIVSIDDEIMFYCSGKHATIDNPNIYFSNCGLYHYNSKYTKLTEVETFSDTFEINYRRVFSANKEFIIHEENFVLAKINRETFAKTYMNYSQISNCRVWKVIFNRDRYIFSIATTIDGTIFTNNIMSFNGTTLENTLQLSISDSTKSIPEMSKVETFLPYITACKAFKLYSVVFCRDSFRTMVIYSIDLLGNVNRKNITFPFNVSIESNIVVKGFDKYIEFFIDKLPNFFENRIIWRYYPEQNKLEELCLNEQNYFEPLINDTIICKSLSKTNIRVSEGFIVGDNCVSDFGCSNTRFNNFTEIGTRSFISEIVLSSPVPKYIDRISGVETSISSICSLKPNYLFLSPLGISRDDCKVYLAYDNVGDVRCIWEYSTNNNDIVDIFIYSETPNVNNITGYNLLGTPSPGSSAFNNVDKWFIGEINNSVVGVIFKRDGGNNKLEYIDTIIYIGVKDKYIIKPTGLDNVKIPSFFFHVFDDTLTDFKIYCKKFGQKYISINKTTTNIVDIFSRSNPVNYISRDYVTIISEYNDINHERYFENKSSIVDVNGIKQVRYISNPLVPYLQPYERFSSSVLNVHRDSDDYYICSMVKSSTFEKTKLCYLDFSSFQGINKIVLFLDFDKKFGNLKDDNINIHAVYSFSFSSDNGVTTIPIEFIQDPNNDFGFYSVIDVSTFDLEQCFIFITNKDCSTNTSRFRIFATVVDDVNIVRTPIGPASCSNFNGIMNTPLYGYSFNNKNLTYSPGLIPRTVNKNILSFLNNSMIEFKITPESNGWLACDVFELFSIDNLILKLQIASVNGSSTLVNCKLENSILPALSFTYDINFPIGCKIKRVDDKISIKLIQSNLILAEFSDISIQTSVVKCSLFDFYFGDINYLSTVDDVINYSTNNIVQYLSDNVYGNVASLIRDYESGLLKAIVSPSSAGTMKDSGILEFSLSDTASVLNKKWSTKIVNDLEFGEIGIAENSAFSIIAYKNKNNDYVNIFKRKTVESFENLETAYLKSISNDNIVNMDGNKIITMELFRT